MTETVARLRIALSDTDPEIWRRVEMPVEASLKMLHDVIQAAMGWQDYHLWEFEADGRRYGLPDPDWPDDTLAAARNIRLKALLDRGIRQLDYMYDMGDSWHHCVTIEAVEPAERNTKYPRYVDGARRCPPEDVGGTPGFETFLEAIGDPSHPDHAELTEWYDECYGGTYDPATVDDLLTRRRVAAIAIRRAAGKAAQAKRRDP
ncbi:MAG TPA: plasmid pRiA4b ORF-3 family protein [Allosphingosinicella sp.]|jgi:hypothetical protein